MSNLKQVYEKYKKRLVEYPHVLSVGVGYKQTNDQTTDQVAIIVFVTRKNTRLPSEDQIPKFLDGIVTDVVVMKNF